MFHSSHTTFSATPIFAAVQCLGQPCRGRTPSLTLLDPRFIAPLTNHGSPYNFTRFRWPSIMITFRLTTSLGKLRNQVSGEHLSTRSSFRGEVRKLCRKMFICSPPTTPVTYGVRGQPILISLLRLLAHYRKLPSSGL